MAGRGSLRAVVGTVFGATLLVAACAPMISHAHRPSHAPGHPAAAGARTPRPPATATNHGATGGATAAATDPPANLPVVASTPAPPPAARHGGKWAPRSGLRWQIQLAGDVLPGGASVYDLDPYATPQQLVGELHAAGAVVMCHLDVGVADPALPDAARLSGEALGPPAPAGGHWLDIRRWDLIGPVLKDRLDLCRTKGFDAVDADHADIYARDTGLPLSLADQVAYDGQVAQLARAAGLAVGERTGAALAGRLLPDLDFAVVDGCFARDDCAAWFGYIDQGKAVFDTETGAPAGFCGRARAYAFAATSVRAGLGAPGTPC